MCYTYLLRCADDSLYCGWTTDLKKREAAHNAGTGSRYTRSRRPVRMVWWEEHATKEEAMRREFHIKRMTREEKLALAETPCSRDPHAPRESGKRASRSEDL